MKTIRDRFGLLLVFAAAMLLLCGEDAVAQLSDEAQDLTTLSFLRMAPCDDIGHPVDLNRVAAGYIYQTYSDSTQIDYTVTEFRRNRTSVILLKGWRNGDIEGDEAITRSDDFTINAGDTLSFYRELEWSTKYPGAQFPDDYSASDTLDYSVELLAAGTNLRLALLDSLRILPRSARGYPVIHMQRPTAAVVRFVAPFALEGVAAYIRVHIHSRGDGDSRFIRYGMRTVQFSDRLLDPAYAARVNLVSGAR